MNPFHEKQPAFRTERFNVFRSRCRNREGVESDTYSAICRYENVLQPACTIIVSRALVIDGQPHVEWIEVNRDMRLKGVGNEVLLGIHDFIGRMNANPVEHASEKLVEAPNDQDMLPAARELKVDASIENERGLSGRATANSEGGNQKET